MVETVIVLRHFQAQQAGQLDHVTLHPEERVVMVAFLPFPLEQLQATIPNSFAVAGQCFYDVIPEREIGFSKVVQTQRGFTQIIEQLPQLVQRFVL